ncbi:MAG: hypothetical protein QGG36_26805 [Pirellulaceae bacterium]|jgi:hypothetical protein|nr:hypothetical protein [Pirellulaceae bacterium]MDP7019436.1 hypothetical protein [Pirellulaceae bacterium]
MTGSAAAGIGKRLVFTVSTGCCGEDRLARLLSMAPGVASLHDPEPDSADAMRDAQHAPERAREFLIEQKFPAIARHREAIYIETSHLFCQGFFEPALEMGLPFDLLLLSRPHRDAATSMFRFDTIPGRTPQGMLRYLSPDDPGVLPLLDWRQLNDYQLCYWYCLEIHRRQQSFAARLSDAGAGRVATLTLAELLADDALDRVVELLDLPKPTPWGKLRANFLGDHVAADQRPPLRLPPLEDLDDWERQVIEQVAAADNQAA